MISIGKISEAQLNAVRKYEANTYKRYSVYLRQKDDAEIIESIEKAKEKDISIRDWLVDLYRGQK